MIRHIFRARGFEEQFLKSDFEIRRLISKHQYLRIMVKEEAGEKD